MHSVFSRAVNLLIGNDMWTLMVEEKADLPLGIRVNLPNFDKPSFRGGEPVSVRSGFVGIGSRFVVDCRTAPRWRPQADREPEPGLARRLALVADAVADRSWHGSVRTAHAVKSAVNDAAALGPALAKVVGRGPGATPSGDDVLVGVLAVLTSPHSGAAGAKAADSLGRSLLPLLPGTTDVSGHLLRQAANGMFGRDVHELVSALIGALSLTELCDKVQRVINTGATSGADTCEGVLAFAPSYLAAQNG